MKRYLVLLICIFLFSSGLRISGFEPGTRYCKMRFNDQGSITSLFSAKVTMTGFSRLKAEG